MDIKFHCYNEPHFKDGQQINAFLYTDYYIEAHNHDFYEMNIVLKGTGTHQIENACFNVKAGDVFVIPPMTVHAYYDTKDLDVYHILLHKEFISANQAESANMPGFLQFVEIEPFLRQHFSDAMFLHLSQNQLIQLKSDLNMIDDSNTFNSREFIPFRNHIMWKILYWLSYLLYNQVYSDKKKTLNKYEQAILQSLEYIHQNYGEKITIELLCKKTYLSRSTFLRNFHDICHCTPMQYLNQYRCKKALEMLDSTDASKTEIAHQCGFYDLSHMERILKRNSL